jgi:hypothetical protein
MTVFTEIADRARLLYSSYPEMAERYRNHAEILRDYRSTPGYERHVDDARHNYRSYAAVCRQYDDLLSELAQLVPKHLPDVWPQLRLVALGARWYEQQDFDWAGGVKELRQIEAAALSRQAQVNGDSDAQVEPKDADWPTQTEVAVDLGFKKRERWRVNRLIQEGRLKTNGKVGRNCRIDPASITSYCKAEGIAYNEQ